MYPLRSRCPTRCDAGLAAHVAAAEDDAETLCVATNVAAEETRSACAATRARRGAAGSAPGICSARERRARGASFRSSAPPCVSAHRKSAAWHGRSVTRTSTYVASCVFRVCLYRATSRSTFSKSPRRNARGTKATRSFLRFLRFRRKVLRRAAPFENECHSCVRSRSCSNLGPSGTPRARHPTGARGPQRR